MIYFIFALILVIILLCFIFSAKNKEYRDEYKNIKTDYTTLQQDIIEQKEQEKEVLSRRRVSPKLKQQVLERDKYTCQICGISKQFFENFCKDSGDYLLLEIDHIQSVKQGGSGDDIDNLQTLCWRCNRKKGSLKSNEEVKDSIDYGISKLLKNINKGGELSGS